MSFVSRRLDAGKPNDGRQAGRFGRHRGAGNEDPGCRLRVREFVDIGCRHGLRSWRTHIFVATPSFVPGYDALGALAMAKLNGPLEAILLLYATGDVERFGLACVRTAFASEALTDAMQRILCGRAAISMDNRAKQLGVRASGYRGLTRSVEVRLRRWLKIAADRFIGALG